MKTIRNITLVLCLLAITSVTIPVFTSAQEQTDNAVSQEATLTTSGQSTLQKLQLQLIKVLQQLISLLTTKADMSAVTDMQNEALQTNDAYVTDAPSPYETDQREVISNIADPATDTTKETDAPEPVAATDESLSCVVDADCTYITTDCSDCELAVMNSSAAQSFNTEKAQQCELDPPMMMCDLAYPGDAQCINNICTIPE